MSLQRKTVLSRKMVMFPFAECTVHSLDSTEFTRFIIIRQEIQFYKYVLFQFVGFAQVNNVKQTLNRLVSHCEQVQHYYLKFPGVMLR